MQTELDKALAEAERLKKLRKDQADAFAKRASAQHDTYEMQVQQYIEQHEDGEKAHKEEMRRRERSLQKKLREAEEQFRIAKSKDTQNADVIDNTSEHRPCTAPVFHFQSSRF